MRVIFLDFRHYEKEKAAGYCLGLLLGVGGSVLFGNARGCGYCMPCTVGIEINNCNRMSLMLRRAPSKKWLSEHWQKEMEKIEDCVNCGVCMTKCPYELQIPTLLRKNLEDYREVLKGNRTV